MGILDFNKKADMGVGTLVVFIAMLLVAAVAAGVLIQTSGSLQEKAIATGQESRNQIATSAFTVEISGTDGRTRNLTDFSQIMKLNPGSEPISLEYTMLSIATSDTVATLKYRGETESFDNDNQNGYNTWMEEEFDDFEVWNNDTSGAVLIEPSGTFNFGVDFDNDGLDDSVMTCDGSGVFCPVGYDGSYFRFDLTHDGVVYIEIINDDGSNVDTSVLANSFSFTMLPVEDYGFISGSRTAGVADDWITFGDAGIYFEFFDAPAVLDEDIDNDNLDDKLAFSATDAIIMLGSNENITISLGVDISDAAVDIQLSKESIVNAAGETLGYLDINAPNAGGQFIPASDSVMITPHKLGQGYYSVVYETESTNHRAGKFIRGDVIRVYWEAPGPIGYDEYVRVVFIPKLGTPTVSSFVTPDVISEQRTYLYP